MASPALAEGGQGGFVGYDPADGTGSTESCQSITHDRLVLGMDESRRPWPNHHSGRLKIPKQSGGYVLVVEGHHITPSGKAAYGRRVGVIADRDLMHHRRSRGVGILSKQPHVDPQTD
jgi:hypothetical protein